MRCFIGIKINDNTLSKIKKMVQNLMSNEFKGNYTIITNIHMTLAFLGEINDDEIKKVKNILNEIDLKKFELHIDFLTKMKDMLILRIKKDEILEKLYQEITIKLKQEKINFDEKNFYPHITLIRKVNKEISKELLFTSEVNKISLFSSERENNLLVYKEIYIKELV